MSPPVFVALLFLIPAIALVTPPPWSPGAEELVVEARDTGPAVQLRVAPSHSALFVPLSGREVREESELDAVFVSMLDGGDAYCEMLYRRRAFERDSAARFVLPARLDDFRASHQSNYLSKLVAGCWNFFIMNDIRPFLDFELARSLYPEQSYDCYSVGFMQPYIMHNILGCRSLQMLDIDWRIHAAHWQLLELYRQDALTNREQALAAIGRLDLGWIAFAGVAPARRHPVRPATLCRYNQDLCLDHLVRFQARRRQLSAVRLDLAALHDGDFHQANPADIKLIYLSNAVEEIYTSRAQFDLLLARVAGTLLPGGRAVYIYHAAGTRALGFYEQVRTDEKVAGYALQTICRDTYRRRDSEGELQNYTTHFERISETARPPTCQAELAKAKLI